MCGYNIFGKGCRSLVYSIEEIRQIVVPIAEKYNLNAVFLFGSYARGEADETSDIDLIVDTAGTDIKGLFALGELYCTLEEAFQKEIDLITVSSLEQSAHLPSEKLFRENIKNERVSLYAVA